MYTLESVVGQYYIIHYLIFFGYLCYYLSLIFQNSVAFGSVYIYNKGMFAIWKTW